MNIAICDDTKEDLGYTRKLCLAYLKKRSIEGEVKAFASGEALLQFGCNDFDIIFLDVRMPGKDGLEVGREIRSRSANAEIIYISSYADYALLSYDVHAYHYLLKDQLDQSFETCFNGVIDVVRSKERKYYFKFVAEEMTVTLRSILYIASRGRRAIFHFAGKESAVENQRPHMNRKLNDLEEELGRNGFIRINQSYLVNIKHIQSVRGFQIVLDNGETLVISKAKYPDVKRQYALLEGGF